MSKRLGDIIQDLVYQVIDATGDYDYLSSASQIHLYAEKRLFSLRRKIANYKRRVEYKNGTTIFLTTHNMEEANQLCERLAIINHGKIAAIDSPEKLRLAISGLQSVVVAFDQPLESESLTNLPGVSQIKKVGDKIQLYTNSPGELICHIVDYARKEKFVIITLNVLAPNLEDVFIKLTEGKKENNNEM